MVLVAQANQQTKDANTKDHARQEQGEATHLPAETFKWPVVQTFTSTDETDQAQSTQSPNLQSRVLWFVRHQESDAPTGDLNSINNNTFHKILFDLQLFVYR